MRFIDTDGGTSCIKVKEATSATPDHFQLKHGNYRAIQTGLTEHVWNILDIVSIISTEERSAAVTKRIFQTEALP